MGVYDQVLPQEGRQTGSSSTPPSNATLCTSVWGPTLERIQYQAASHPTYTTMSKLHTLIRWTDPPLTGLVAGSGLVFLISLSFFSFLSVVAYFGLSLVLAVSVTSTSWVCSRNHAKILWLDWSH